MFKNLHLIAKHQMPLCKKRWILLFWICVPFLTYAQNESVYAFNKIEKQKQGEKMLPLQDILQDLEKQYGVKFAFNDKLVENKFADKSKLQFDKLETTLALLLQPLDLQFKKIDNYYVIQKLETKRKEVKKINSKESIKESSYAPSEGLERLTSSEFFVKINKIENIKVTGKVTSQEDGTPLPGVNIIEKGTVNGTVTDIEGNYTLEIPARATLIFSFVGYVSEEAIVGNQSVIDMVLSPDIKSLQEVVVIGYGSQDKKVTTAATVTVKTDDIVKTNSLRVEQALQGQAAGVQISTNSGQPGESLKVRIRGTGTIGQSEPLYVVDGVPTEDISYLNPAAIERVDILKDAASAAIYGARAANGVVLISTKQGKSGKVQLSLDSYYGVQNLYKTLPMLNATEYAVIMNEANINSGQLPYFSLDQINNFGEGTNWLDEAVNANAPTQNHNLSLTGGNDVSTYSTSLSYFQQQGIIGGNHNKSNFERLTFTINSAHNALNGIVKLGENLSYSNVDKRGLRVGSLYNNSLRGLFNASPIFPVYDENGEFARSILDQANETNPIGAMYYQDFNKNITDRIFGNIYGELQPIKHLVFRSDFGMDLSLYSGNSFNPVYILNDATRNNISNATQNYSRNIRWNWDNTVRYSKDINNHYLELLAGITAQKNVNTNMSATKSGLIFNNFDQAYLNNGTIDTTVLATGGQYEYALYSQFGRINYNYNQKYLISTTIRRDGSSNLGQDNRYGIFPSVSVGWVVTEENFLKSISPINFLKLRTSWGQNGNDRIGKFAYLATLSSTNKEYYFGTGETKYVGSSPDKIPNSKLKWEASEQLNIGLDATIFKNFSITLDAYKKTTKDWLLVAPVPALVGTNAPTVNGGSIVNKGIEMALAYNRTFGDWEMGISANASFNENEVTEIKNQEKIIHGGGQQLSQSIGEVNRVQVGFPVGYFWGYETAGIFQNMEEINSYVNNEKVVQPTALPGDVIFVDRNKDGKISDLDKTNIGDPNPDITYGFNYNLKFKGFDFSIYTYGMAGHQNVFGVRSPERWYNNYTTDVLNRWHGEGTSHKVPRATLGNEPNQNYLRFSDLYIQNASFLRVKAVTLGYEFTDKFTNLPFSSLRLYVSGNNLFTFTKYKGMDPEVGFGPQSFSQGFDIGYYPQPRTLIAGLSIKF